MSDWPRFVDGQVYRWQEIAQYTWTEHGDRRNVSPDTLFLCSKPAGEIYGVFDEIVEESPYSLVSAEEALEDIAELRRRGFSMQDISRAAGISLDSAHRAAAGNGAIRRSTRDALRAAAHGRGGMP